MKRITMLLGAGILILSSMVYAAVPQLISIQGNLRDGSGNPVANGNYSVVFTIYDAATGGSNLWQETQAVNTVNGLFNVLLGIGPIPLDYSIFNDSTRWLGTKVGADPEMTPRQRLTSMGYSHRVGSVDGATGGSINGSLSFGNSSLPMLYVYESGLTNPTRPIIAHSPAYPDYGLAYDDNNEQMNFLGSGTPVLSLGLDSRFVGVNRSTAITGAEYFGVLAPVATGNYGGMYISTGGNDGWPFYGYATNSRIAWTYLNGQTGDWKLYNNGDRITVTSSGNVGIGTTAPTENLEVAGNLKVTGAIIGSLSWTGFPFTPGHENTSIPVQYRKIGDIVYIRGVLRRSDFGAIGCNEVVGVLPAGFRPPTVVSYYLGSSSFYVEDDGEIRAYCGSPTSITFDGFFFSTTP